MLTATSSPTSWPSRASPRGDSLEIRPLPGSASADPTMRKISGSSPRSTTVTREPRRTLSEGPSSSMRTACFRVDSMVRIRPSKKACSFLASSYPTFSMMSPSSLAARMRWATSGRLTEQRYSNSFSSFRLPSGVKNIALSVIFFPLHQDTKKAPSGAHRALGTRPLGSSNSLAPGYERREPRPERRGGGASRANIIHHLCRFVKSR